MNRKEIALIIICSIFSVIIAQEYNIPNIMGKITGRYELKDLAFVVVVSIVGSQELACPNICRKLKEYTGNGSRYALDGKRFIEQFWS